MQIPMIQITDAIRIHAEFAQQGYVIDTRVLKRMDDGQYP